MGLLPRLLQCVCRTNALCFWKGIPVNAIACHERKWSATHKLRIILADIYMAQYVRRREFIITLPDFVCIPFHKFDKHDVKIVMRTGVQNHPTLFDCNHGFQKPIMYLITGAQSRDWLCYAAARLSVHLFIYTCLPRLADRNCSVAD